MKDQRDGGQNHGTFSIQNSDAMPHFLDQLRNWFEAEWGHVDPFEGNHPEIIVPKPRIAVDGMGTMVGGLSFSSFPKPENAEIGVWINAVLVAPTHRKKGIASQLIQSAERAASQAGISELFVLTDVSKLYQKLGWKIVGLDCDDTILTKALVGE